MGERGGVEEVISVVVAFWSCILERNERRRDRKDMGVI